MSDAQDAARYRWLRGQHWSEGTLAVVTLPRLTVAPGTDCPSGDRLDTLIDALIKTESLIKGEIK